ncbi:hypothetical protein EIP91_001273 [Steccherinum ochraceum]|uniref:Uncharacterized protein n=1 Tax=Steccherinum ochraceum TaxID=92696 RepID=A0A4R0RHD9_9APHY|nr:hypothetical protein EIP91_001273 [Steccherinum ochraceum]
MDIHPQQTGKPSFSVYDFFLQHSALLDPATQYDERRVKCEHCGDAALQRNAAHKVFGGTRLQRFDIEAFQSSMACFRFCPSPVARDIGEQASREEKYLTPLVDVFQTYVLPEPTAVQLHLKQRVHDSGMKSTTIIKEVPEDSWDDIAHGSETALVSVVFVSPGEICWYDFGYQEVERQPYKCTRNADILATMIGLFIVYDPVFLVLTDEFRVSVFHSWVPTLMTGGSARFNSMGLLLRADGYGEAPPSSLRSVLGACLNIALGRHGYPRYDFVEDCGKVDQETDAERSMRDARVGQGENPTPESMPADFHALHWDWNSVLRALEEKRKIWKQTLERPLVEGDVLNVDVDVFSLRHPPFKFLIQPDTVPADTVELLTRHTRPKPQDVLDALQSARSISMISLMFVITRVIHPPQEGLSVASVYLGHLVIEGTPATTEIYLKLFDDSLFPFKDERTCAEEFYQPRSGDRFLSQPATTPVGFRRDNKIAYGMLIEAIDGSPISALREMFEGWSLQQKCKVATYLRHAERAMLYSGIKHTYVNADQIVMVQLTTSQLSSPSRDTIGTSNDEPHFRLVMVDFEDVELRLGRKVKTRNGTAVIADHFMSSGTLEAHFGILLCDTMGIAAKKMSEVYFVTDDIEK